ncbi:flagellin [Frigidibacter oleivorans]|uniref:flagellin n=1 Tax=Frigidibacter oleivorans TaxID=2487129 RepID=UPI000F8E63BC|nr:flagellin [Frigidibacter oleivorans]
MTFTSIGDLAQSMTLRRQNAELALRLDRLGRETVTGLADDRAAAVSGRFSTLSGIERALATLDAHDRAAAEAAVLTSAAAAALSGLDDLTAGFGADLAGLAGAADIGTATLGAEARARLDQAVALLGASAGGRHVFAGAATDTAPLAPAGTLMAALSAAAAGAATVEDAAAAVGDWFAAPAGAGGYLDTVYLGSDNPMTGFRLGDGMTVAAPPTAADPALRAVIEGLALAALVDGGTFAGDPAAQAQLLQAAGQRLLAAAPGLVALQARTGTAGSTIAEAQTRNAAEATALELARAGLIGVDQYDAATELQAVQTQIETLYAVTARLSQLSLADYL